MEDGQSGFVAVKSSLSNNNDNDDDNEPAANIIEDKSVRVHSTDDSETKSPSVSDTSVDSKTDTEIYQKGEVQKGDEDGEELQEANSLQGRSIRQVVLFTFAAVMLTIHALSSLGFSMDFTVIESPRIAAEPKNLINIGMATKKEAPDTTVEHTKSRDEKAVESLKALKDLVAEIKEL